MVMLNTTPGAGKDRLRPYRARDAPPQRTQRTLRITAAVPLTLTPAARYPHASIRRARRRATPKTGKHPGHPAGRNTGNPTAPYAASNES